MAGVKGRSGGKRPNSGRKKGTPNRMTKDLKEMILGALDQAGGKEGGQAYLLRQATENPTAFLSLVGKVLPMTVQGDQDNPLKTVVEITWGGLSE